MTTILVDARYIGSAIKHGRETVRMQKNEVAKIFGITLHQYHRIERGTMLPSSNMLGRLMALAFLQMRTRGFVNAKSLAPLKPDPDQIVIVPADAK